MAEINLLSSECINGKHLECCGSSEAEDRCFCDCHDEAAMHDFINEADEYAQ